MEQKTLLFILAGLLFLAPRAGAENFGSLFGSLATAKATGKGQTTLSGSLGFTDATSFIAGISHGFTDRADGRFRVGVIEENNFETQFSLAGDMRWQLWNAEDMSAIRPKPFDMSVGGFAEWIRVQSDAFGSFIESMSVTQIGFQMTGSRGYPMSNGHSLTPYGRLNLRYEWMSIDYATGLFFPEDTNDSHLALGLNTGVSWRLSPPFALFGELQIDGNEGIFLGVDYGM